MFGWKEAVVVLSYGNHCVAVDCRSGVLSDPDLKSSDFKRAILPVTLASVRITERLLTPCTLFLCVMESQVSEREVI